MVRIQGMEEGKVLKRIINYINDNSVWFIYVIKDTQTGKYNEIMNM